MPISKYWLYLALYTEDFLCLFELFCGSEYSWYIETVYSVCVFTCACRSSSCDFLRNAAKYKSDEGQSFQLHRLIFIPVSAL